MSFFQVVTCPTESAS